MAANSITVERKSNNTRTCRAYTLSNGYNYRLHAYWGGGRHASYRLASSWRGTSFHWMDVSPFGWNGPSVTSFRTLPEVIGFAEWWFARIAVQPTT